jgi:arabinosyltransferase
MQYPEADILTSSDHLAATATDGGLEHWPQASSAANIGIMLFRAPAAKLADEWVAVLDEDPMVWDQNAFNDLFLRGAEPLPERRDRLFL